MNLARVYLIGTLFFVGADRSAGFNAFFSSGPLAPTKAPTAELRALPRDGRDVLDSGNASTRDPPAARRSFLGFLASGAAASFSCQTPAAFAAYGDSAAIKTPGVQDYINFLIESSATVDESKYLYKGADRGVQLKRLSNAVDRLQEIPKLAEEKKWSQVEGILTGPLGTLVATMNQVASGNAEAVAAAKKVKGDIYAIGTGAQKKSSAMCIENVSKATKSLEAFVKVAF
mmetsp:Transcript_10271/g.21611  ORF Transcript_10271/g.21611 Transcript_10271/m.21611 type:complete len:230 (-) Transcript_10271:65-754(-)